MTKCMLLLPGAAAALAAAAFALPAGAASGVTLKDDYFSPKTKTVSHGSTVKFTWGGTDYHNVTITGPAKFASKTQNKGTYSVKFAKKGTYKVVCTIHSGMAMTVKAT